MNTTLVVCITIVMSLVVIGIFGTVCFTSLLRFKHEEVKEYRTWISFILSEFYTRMDRWVDKLSE